LRRSEKEESQKELKRTSSMLTFSDYSDTEEQRKRPVVKKKKKEELAPVLKEVI